MVERLEALERLEMQRYVERSAAERDTPETAAPPPSSGPAPAPAAGPVPAAEPDPAERLEARFGGNPQRWIERLEELENTRDPVRRKELARELAQSPIPALRLEGLKTLLEVDSDEGLAAVRALVADAAQNPRSQRMAARSVALLGDVAGREIDEALYEFLGSPAANVQNSVLRTLEQRGDAAPMRAALAAQQPGLTSPDPRTRVSTLRNVGGLRSPSAVAVIAPLLRDPDPIVRIQAVDAMGRTGDGASALPAVQPLLADPVPAVRDAATRAVLRLNRGPEDPEPQGPESGRRGFRLER
jgi:hypothetical protein